MSSASYPYQPSVSAEASQPMLKQLSLIILELNQAAPSERWDVLVGQMKAIFRAEVFAKTSLIPGTNHDRDILWGKTTCRTLSSQVDHLDSIKSMLMNQTSTRSMVSQSGDQLVAVMGFNTQGPTGLVEVARVGQPWRAEEVLAIESIASFMGILEVGVVARMNQSPASHSKTGHRSEQEMIGHSAALANIVQMAKKVAKTSSAVLIEGESGTGKELLAKMIHAESLRNDKPFVSLNCGALTETLLESELFGHERGAFTGAVQAKEGLAESAHGGTLFLDEVGEMSPGLQAKVLRFLQEGEFYRVGSTKPIKVDVRIVAATNRSLVKEVTAGRFREDLFYRLNVMNLKTPSLRDRAEDIPTLINYFMGDHTARITPEALVVFQRYSWPGNIRELKNIVERVRVFAENGVIDVRDLPEAMVRQVGTLPSSTEVQMVTAGPEGESKVMPLDDLERIHILKTLEMFYNNKTRASKALGITVKTLYNKLHRYGMEHLIQASNG